MKKLVIIPAYNEEESILTTVQDVLDNAPGFDYVVVNDCSRDSTLAVCRKHGLNVLDLPINLGIGGAIQTGYRYALEHGYDVAVQFDGDGQHDARFLQAMADKLERDGLDMVIGSRFINNEGFQSTGLRRLGIRFFEKLIKLLYGVRITDATSGMRLCGHAVLEQFAREYPQDYPEPETVARLLRHKFKVEEMPVIMRERQAGTSSINPAKSVYYMIKVSLAILIEKVR